MSNDFPLSPELEEIEQRIGQRRFVAPSGVRSQILSAVNAELIKPRTTQTNREHLQGFAVAVAAALLIGLNLARISASVSNAPRSRECEPPSAAVTAAIAELEPAVGPEESQRVVILAEARAAARNTSPRGSSTAQLGNL